MGVVGWGNGEGGTGTVTAVFDRISWGNWPSCFSKIRSHEVRRTSLVVCVSIFDRCLVGSQLKKHLGFECSEISYIQLRADKLGIED